MPGSAAISPISKLYFSLVCLLIPRKIYPKPDAHCGSAAHFCVINKQLALMVFFYNSFCYTQSQSPASFLGAVARFKNLFLIFFFYSHSGINDINKDFIFTLMQPNRYLCLGG